MQCILGSWCSTTPSSSFGTCEHRASASQSAIHTRADQGESCLCVRVQELVGEAREVQRVVVPPSQRASRARHGRRAHARLGQCRTVSEDEHPAVDIDCDG